MLFGQLANGPHEPEASATAIICRLGCRFADSVAGLPTPNTHAPLRPLRSPSKGGRERSLMRQNTPPARFHAKTIAVADTSGVWALGTNVLYGNLLCKRIAVAYASGSFGMFAVADASGSFVGPELIRRERVCVVHQCGGSVRRRVFIPKTRRKRLRRRDGDGSRGKSRRPLPGRPPAANRGFRHKGLICNSLCHKNPWSSRNRAADGEQTPRAAVSRFLELYGVKTHPTISSSPKHLWANKNGPSEQAGVA